MTAGDGIAARAAAALLGAGAALAACGGEAGSPDGEASRDTALERMAREAVPRVEASAGLGFRFPPRVSRSSRGRLEAFLTSELEKQLPPRRAEGMRAAYARLGLLPDTLDLRALVRSLYLEQVVGYYSPEADTLFVREGVSGGTLEPVLVHELVHALQDQHMDLDSLTRARRGSNDGLAAALAALEGHATYVMLEDALGRRTGGDVDLGAVDLRRLLEGLDLAGMAGAPELSRAPRLVRESLVFPYTEGLFFLQAYWSDRDGRPPPLGGDLPASTEQVLHPGRFAGDRRDAPTDVRFAADAPPGWEQVHGDGLGEFEVRLWLSELLADSARARRAAAGWDGDRYRLLSAPGGGEVLAWVTVWDGGADADEFAAAAERALEVRYGSGENGADRPGGGPGEARRPGTPGDGERTVRVRRERLDGRPAVVLTDAPQGRADDVAGWTTRVELEEPGRP